MSSNVDILVLSVIDCLAKMQHLNISVILVGYFMSPLKKEGHIAMSPFDMLLFKEKGHIALHMSVGWSVCQSLGMLVCQSPLNLVQPITQKRFALQASNLVGR